MVVFLVILILIIIFLAVFTGKNLAPIEAFWFFKTFHAVPVAVLILIAFGCGILFSVLVYLVFKIKKSSSKEEPELTSEDKEKRKIEKQQRKLAKQAKKNAKKDSKNKMNSESAKSDETIVQTNLETEKHE